MEAAPEPITAAQMRAAQAEKATAYTSHIAGVARPFENLMIARLEQTLQLVREELRPASQLTTFVTLDNVSLLDLVFVVNYLTATITAIFESRGFVVSVVLRPVVGTPVVEARLKW